MELPKVTGTGHIIRLATGREARVVMLNNAATTPPLKGTLEEVNGFLATYGALHRGAGPHATATFNRVQESIENIRRFINAGDDHALLFTRNTTAAVNLFVRILGLDKGDVVISSPIEHTSNNLPWRHNTDAGIIETDATEDGALDYDDLERKAEKNGVSLKLLALNGASNTTGFVPDLARLSRIAHRHNAMLFIDAAQLAPHRHIDMKRDGMDALAFSAHKLYAPFGIGVLALPKRLLRGAPIDPGGGTVDMVTDKGVLWMKPVEMRFQAGTWNGTGIAALGASCRILAGPTLEAVMAHERSLVEYAVKKLFGIDGVRLYVPADKFIGENRTGIFSFNIKGMHHSLVAAALEHEYGIETRSGAICNHRVIRRWLGVPDDEQKRIEEKMVRGNRLASYGIVRASIGFHNTTGDIDLLAGALSELAGSGPALRYREIPEEDTFVPIL